jgi:hypothetical protein
MSRTFLDDDLLEWEAYVSGGRRGLPEDARIVFHCRSDPTARARQWESDLEDDDLAARLTDTSDAELRGLLAEAEPLN